MLSDSAVYYYPRNYWSDCVRVLWEERIFMEVFNFDLQRFAIVPTLLTGEDGNGVRYWNTIPGAEVIGFGTRFSSIMEPVA